MGLINLVQKIVNETESIKVSLVPTVEKTDFSLKEKISKEYYLILKNRKQSYSLSAKAIRQEAVKNKGNVRHMLRMLKNDAGQNARINHIALCFLRGKKYSEVESNVSKNNKINIDKLSKYLNLFITNNYRKANFTADIKKFLEE